MTLVISRFDWRVLCAAGAMFAASCALDEDGEAGSDDPPGQAVQAATTCSVPGFVSGSPTPIGFASLDGNTTGGGSATPQVVTTLAQLNTAAGGTGAAVIFVSGKLAQGTVKIGSNKTIVGCSGTAPTLSGHVDVNGSANVIVRNINIVGFNCKPPDVDTSNGGQCQNGQDAVTVQKSHNVWFDHDAISDGSDGNLDIVHASDFITVSYTKFFYSSARSDPNDTGAAGHRFSNLIGGSDGNKSEDTGHLNITWHHDWWAQNVVERQPRIRFGKNHLFNNLWSSTGDDYAIGVGVGASILTQNNAFTGIRTPIDETSFVDSSIASSSIKSTGNVLSGTTGTAPADLNAGSVFTPPYTVNLGMGSSTSAFVQANAGPM
jgi:pectate lyase